MGTKPTDTGIKPTDTLLYTPAAPLGIAARIIGDPFGGGSSDLGKKGDFAEDQGSWLPEFPDLSPRLLNPENKWQFDAINNDTGGALQRAIDRKNAEVERRNSIERDRSAVQERLKGIREKEEQLKGVLRGETETAVSALDQQLDRLLTEAGINAGQARAQVGAQMADRGLNRSTFANRAIEDVTSQEQAQKGQLRLKTQQSQTGVKEQEQKVYRTLDEQRERMSLAKTLAELDQAEQQTALWDETALKADFQQKLTDMELSAKDTAFLWNTIGGIAKSGATIFALA